jgi:hypothetical protein
MYIVKFTPIFEANPQDFHRFFQTSHAVFYDFSRFTPIFHRSPLLHSVLPEKEVKKVPHINLELCSWTLVQM